MATDLRESQESVPPSAPPMQWRGRPASYNEEPPRYQSLSVDDSDHHRGPEAPTPRDRRNTLNRSLAFAGNVITELFSWQQMFHVTFVLTRSFNWTFFRCSR